MTFMEASSMSSMVMALRLRAGSQQSRLVDQVFQVSAGEAGGAPVR